MHLTLFPAISPHSADHKRARRIIAAIFSSKQNEMEEGVPAAGFEEAGQAPLSSSYYMSPSHHSSSLRTHEHSPPPGGLSTMLTDLPPSVQSLLLNILLIFLTIYLSNASDYLRGIVHKVRVFVIRSIAANFSSLLAVLCGRPRVCVCGRVLKSGVPPSGVINYGLVTLLFLCCVCICAPYVKCMCMCLEQDPATTPICKYKCLGSPLLLPLIYSVPFPFPTYLTQNPNLRFRFLLRLVTDMPESTIAVAAGMILGLLLSRVFNIRTQFSEEVFFYFILPPIIFYQG